MTVHPSNDRLSAMSNLPRELDHRYSDRMAVSLLWDERDDRVTVVVADHKTGACFEIDVRDGERALDVFHHPFAYAALRGIDTDLRSDSELPLAA
jgi:hypothetical protein